MREDSRSLLSSHQILQVPSGGMLPPLAYTPRPCLNRADKFAWPLRYFLPFSSLSQNVISSQPFLQVLQKKKKKKLTPSQKKEQMPCELAFALVWVCIPHVLHLSAVIDLGDNIWLTQGPLFSAAAASHDKSLTTTHRHKSLPHRALSKAARGWPPS